MNITGSTKLVGIFGDPVEQSVSPAMHNAAFASLGLNMAYVPFHVLSKPPGVLKAAVAAIRALGIKGVNVTIPHKEKVIRHLNEVDPHAREIGAVNVIVNRDGVLTGYNTDGPGYLLSLREDTGFIPRDRKVIIIGAGGSARAVLHSILGGHPSTVVIANRTIKRAETLAREFSEKFEGIEIKTTHLKRKTIKEHSADAGLVVNTTSLGMAGKGKLDVDIEAFPPTAVVSDVVYTPLKTELLKNAEARGMKTHSGLSMLVRQGVLSFELWTGQKPPIDVMRKAAIEALY